MKTKHRTAARAKQRQRDTEYTQPNWLDKLADDLRKREQAHRWPVKQERIARGETLDVRGAA